MAEIGENGATGLKGGGGEDGVEGLKPSHDPLSPARCPSSTPPGEAHAGGLRRGIVIQLTGTEGEWDSLEDNELIFPLEHDYDDQTPFSSLSKERQSSIEENQHYLHSPPFHVPLSPSSPGALGDCSVSAPSFLTPGPASPTHRPLVSLVKSLSAELELPQNPSLRPKPFLSLVKSISTEISRSEPEVSQSKSDSLLNLHLQWKNLTQPKGRSNGDSRTAPPSPIALSPSESPKAGFFKIELEDTKRKFSEAMQEPMFSKPISMFSKIMGDEKENAAAGSPKHQRTPGARSASSSVGRTDSTEGAVTESPLRGTRRVDSDATSPLFDWPCVRLPKKGRTARTCSLHDHPGDRLHDKLEELEIRSYNEVLQVMAVGSLHHRRPLRSPGPPISTGHRCLVGQSVSPPPLPWTGLFSVCALSYAYFTLPLSSYVSGLALGMAFGFLLGLLLIRLGLTRHAAQTRVPHRHVQALTEAVQQVDVFSTQSNVLKGWMNEVLEYDAETYHPSLSHSVLVTLEGPSLRLDYPRNNISRRATYDEKPLEPVVLSSRCFQLQHSKVFLLPSALARKRLWNLKYPICIELAEGEGVVDKDRGIQETPGEQLGEDSQTQNTSTPKTTANVPTTLYLFGRTGREKEEWFHHFMSSSMVTEKEKTERTSRCVSRSDMMAAQGVSPSRQSQDSRGPSRIESAEEDVPSSPFSPPNPQYRMGFPLLDHSTYMARFLASEQPSPLPSPPFSTDSSPTDKQRCTCDSQELKGEGQTEWANALIGRIFWDFLHEKYWSDVVSRKIQKKLGKIRLPYFMNELTLTELDMGSCLPQITSASRPVVNSRGLWLELEVVYTGALQMTLETKINLSKLGKEGGLDTDCLSDPDSLGEVTLRPRSRYRSRPILSVLADSDEESSSAGSSDEEEVLLSDPQGTVTPPCSEGVAASGGRTGKRILRFVDKIAKSKYFQKATENEYIKKKIEEMSNTPLLLAVEVQELSGTLAVNIPPPPTDRIWYSFCVPPKLDLRVRPKLGEREVTFCHVTEWIEKKLQDEFQKVFVLPNMDDIYLPLMHSGMDGYPKAQQHQRCPAQSSYSRHPSMESIGRTFQDSTAAQVDQCGVLTGHK
ncbi:testis-expressed protein 2 isoform X1 [Esox lucius]|uniref:SMP-LTD domain-containing protein n=1 Tax=Esox lucius TaxID=8010 RepID=A0A3P8YSV9_ESOLU|nr:testis-expressed protein 2 isoform X1 [Esox lucius]XP_034148336.1 testis-expressed protein 2 isoform X1 [Esox lucius]XP_034148337.1 testis-expressed protein 2 isoform X1 [Esox lucius]XP_034148338.1 testis-expressed protein 2 isoform X1 [Esox lucius]XP_034148339.1 testis-expressed protein 2 isoform X1 [Esox lucius]